MGIRILYSKANVDILLFACLLALPSTQRSLALRSPSVKANFEYPIKGSYKSGAKKLRLLNTLFLQRKSPNTYLIEGFRSCQEAPYSALFR